MKEAWLNDHGMHRYENINRQKADMPLRELHHCGATVSGDNPWEADTHRSGVKLRGQLKEAASKLEVTVVGRDWYVPCSMI